MKKVVLATGNPGKVKELQSLLADLGIEVVPQSEFDVPEAEETGSTFVENAIIKARNAAKHTGLPAIADDSGLSVDFLGGEPGVYSARYAGADANDSDNIVKLLDAMKDAPAGQRGAKFNCVLVLMQHENDPTPIIAHGQWQGEILHEIQGEGGFGYDPVFWVESLNRSAAQLEKAEKNAISHRGQALQKLLAQLRD
ncbi:XTP/dITP diphosphatase [Paraneptunicella aestuarii]|uniref:XTP/dITP diphosphatase n=1 Tax=Paraneptunicella aestuarii TaxID=2831148 RepID=UPI001E307D1C|nr:XTP/dITP diphosphatase [Paraneptunicella aestuarii]UAA37970.1 XTP/dITP diphosphatase [Paraneptunicella aestuarii]